MAVKKELEIVISPDGETTLTTSGFKGADCEREVKPFEKALGKTLQRKRTREYYEKAAARSRVSTQAK